MKRPNSSDSLGALRSICQNSPDDEHVNNQEPNSMYARDHEFHHHQTMMDGLYEEGGSVEESLGSGHVSEKKRRLSNEQVKALEKNFEVENKLEPERKVKLAQELGLQPRQVAVWFQNRRARWKTKNLERDYGVLKSNYDALKHDCEALLVHNESLLKEIQELKSKLKEDGNGQVSVKQEPFVSEADEKGKHEVEAAHVRFPDKTIESDTELNLDDDSKNGHMVLYDSKDHGSSDSDSSALLNEDNNNSYSPVLDQHKFLGIHNGSSSSMNVSCQFSNAEASEINNTLEDSKRAYQPQFVKIEEHDFFGEEESCTTTFFSDEQAPTLNWYNPDEWN